MKQTVTLFLLLCVSNAFAQDAIINEWSQGDGGSKEWVELIVLSDNLDMRNWTLQDNNTSVITFADVAEWQSVAFGTIIVVYNGSDKATGLPEDDVDFSDNVVVIPHNNQEFFSGGWIGFSNSTAVDNPSLSDANTEVVHDWDQGENVAFLDIHPGANDYVAYIGNTAEGVSNPENWVLVANTPDTATPGAFNGGLNPELPVELTSFEAVLDGATVTLLWSTASESNNAGFEVQQSSGVTFAAVGFVAGTGTSSEEQSYRFKVGNLPAGEYKFRLKQVDFDGQYSLSESVSVIIVSDQPFALSETYPNPFNPQTSIALSIARDQHVNIAVYNVMGQRVAMLFDGVLEANQERTFSFDASGLSSGTYLVRVVGEHFTSVREALLVK